MPPRFPDNASQDYARVAAAIEFLEANAGAQPALEAVAAHLGLSAPHAQRVFQRWAGISPKRLLQLLTLDHARELLARGTPVLETALEAGLSGPGRLHELFVTLEAMSPGEYRLGGAGLAIRAGFAASPFGRVFLAATARGVCGLGFCDPEDDAAVEADLRRRWPRAAWTRDDAASAALARRIFAGEGARGPLAVLVRGTNFQVQVWRALLAIPEGAATSYAAVAARAGRPAAVRAAAGAVGDNPVAWLIPCHRVLRTGGAPGGYRWGLARKRAMLAWEAARHAPPP